MENKTEILQPDKCYHIYNRANGSENLFLSDENYRFFLQKYFEYILPIAHTYCYCLMPNHFHFLIRIKSELELVAFFESAFPKFKTLEEHSSSKKLSSLEKYLSKQFSNLFSSYTQAFNKQQNRKGSLFIKNFKRKPINDNSYLLKLVHYIHFNPVKAKLCKNPQDYKHSSYSLIYQNKDTPVNKKELIEWFNDIENFIYVHTLMPQEF